MRPLRGYQLKYQQRERPQVREGKSVQVRTVEARHQIPSEYLRSRAKLMLVWHLEVRDPETNLNIHVVALRVNHLRNSHLCNFHTAGQARAAAQQSSVVLLPIEKIDREVSRVAI